MENTDEAYYLALAVLERIDEERKKLKMGNCIFSKFLSRSPAYWTVRYGEARVLRISTILEIAKKINISMEYLLYGKNYGSFKETKTDIKNISRATAKNRIYLTESQKSVVSRIRHGVQKDIGVNMFFQLEDKLKKNLWNIITNC